MTTLPVPLISLLRKIFTAFSSYQLSGVIKAITLPSLGYILGLTNHSRTSLYASSIGRNSSQQDQKAQGKMPPESEGEQMPEKSKEPQKYHLDTPIYQLMNNPALFDPLRPPRDPVVLAHGGSMSLVCFFVAAKSP